MFRELAAPPVQLMGKALQHPDRAILRLVLMARLARRGIKREHRRLLEFLSEQFRVEAHALLAEHRQSEFVDWFRGRRAKLSQISGHRLGTTPQFGSETLYLAVRAARPQVVVETGVLYGASSAHILEALERNGEGMLYSIELGHEAHGEPPHDFLVPKHLKKRWRLIIGDSRHELPALLERLGGIDFFHHDSLHTFEHMRWEYETAFPYLRSSGILSSDDVLISHSLREIGSANAFTRFCEGHRIRWATFNNAGIAIKEP